MRTPLHPAALASVPYRVVLVRVQVLPLTPIPCARDQLNASFMFESVYLEGLGAKCQANLENLKIRMFEGTRTRTNTFPDGTEANAAG